MVAGMIGSFLQMCPGPSIASYVAVVAGNVHNPKCLPGCICFCRTLLTVINDLGQSHLVPLERQEVPTETLVKIHPARFKI